jgi:hypothetical protein
MPRRTRRGARPCQLLPAPSTGCEPAEESHESASVRLASGRPERGERSDDPRVDYLTSALIAWATPMVMGIASQIAPVNARWVHCWVVRAPLNRALWA